MAGFQAEDEETLRKQEAKNNARVTGGNFDETGVSRCDTKECNEKMTSSFGKDKNRSTDMKPHHPTNLTLRGIKTSLQSADPQLTENKFLIKKEEACMPKSLSSLSPSVYNQRNISDKIEAIDNGNNLLQRKYRDISLYADPIIARGRNCGGVTEPFPEKLHNMLEYAEKLNLTEVVSFLPHGRAFAVHLPKRFVAEIMPRFFRQTRITSFQRQLNLYGFQRICNGPDTGAYYHELFLRGRPGLAVIMRRTKVKGTMKSKRNSIVNPDFYSMSPVVGDNQCSNFSKGDSNNAEKDHYDYLHKDQQINLEPNTNCSSKPSTRCEVTGESLENNQVVNFQAEQQKKVGMTKKYKANPRFKIQQQLQTLAPQPAPVGQQNPFYHSHAQYLPIPSIITGNRLNHISQPLSMSLYRGLIAPQNSNFTSGNRPDNLSVQRLLDVNSSYQTLSVQDSIQLQQIKNQTLLQKIPMNQKQSSLLTNLFSSSAILSSLKVPTQSDPQNMVPMKMNDIASQTALHLYETDPSQSISSSRLTAFPNLSKIYLQQQRSQDHHRLQTQLGHTTRSAAIGRLSNITANVGLNQNNNKSHVHVPFPAMQLNHLYTWSYPNKRDKGSERYLKN